MIRQKIRLVDKGIPFQSEVDCLILEYFHRIRLSKMGYHSNFENLSVWKADAFLTISEELDKIRSEEMKAAKAKR